MPTKAVIPAVIPAKAGKAGTHALAASRYDATTLAAVQRACAHLTEGHPITHYRENPDGSYSAFNDIGQKFIVIVTPLNDLPDEQPAPAQAGVIPAKAVIPAQAGTQPPRASR